MTTLYLGLRLVDATHHPAADPNRPGDADAADASFDDDGETGVDRGNRLGTWSATRLALRPARFVLAVSEHARLAVVLDALPLDTVPVRLPEALYRLLLAIKVPADLARRERDAMQPMRPVRDSMAGLDAGLLAYYANALKAAWDAGLSRSPDALGVHLAGLENEWLLGATPAQAARRRFHLLPDQTEALGL